MKFIYNIKGMHCAACVEKIKSVLSSHVNILELSLQPPILKIEASEAPSLGELNAYLAKVGPYHLQDGEEEASDGLWAYYPLFLLTLYLLGVPLINNMHSGYFDWHEWMIQFMAGFFLVFSAFKLLDIQGFARAYATYDLLAKRRYFYGFIYPFLELGLGILYLTHGLDRITNILTIIIMGFSSIGVINSLLKKQKIQCACLGTIFKLPLSFITLIEDLTMLILAVLALII